MKKINLRELYPDVYTTDFFVDVTEEVMETIRAAERAEAAYERKMYRYKAQYSLDCENGIENAVLLKPQTPEMVLEEKQFQEQVYAAVMKLPEKQAKRLEGSSPRAAVLQALSFLSIFVSKTRTTVCRPGFSVFRHASGTCGIE